MATNLEIRKQNLFSWIIQLNDESILSRLDSLGKSKTSDNTFELTDDMKKAVDKAIESLESGKVKSHEDVMAKAKNKFPNLRFA